MNYFKSIKHQAFFVFFSKIRLNLNHVVSGRVEKWRSGGVDEWKRRGVEEWRSGGVEEWRSGGVEEWRSGGVKEYYPSMSGELAQH